MIFFEEVEEHDGSVVEIFYYDVWLRSFWRVCAGVLGEPVMNCAIDPRVIQIWNFVSHGFANGFGRKETK